MPNSVYEGQVSVWDKKADGSPLIIGKGDRQGEPYFKISFKVGGEYVNLMDFDGVTRGQKGDYRVEYYQKFAPNGEPELYNGKPQYQLVDIRPLGAQTAQNGPSTAQATPSTSAPAFDAKTQDIRRAVAIKAATELTVAMLPHMMEAQSFAYLDRVFEDAARIEVWLESGTVPNELDEMMAAAKDKLMDDVADDDADIPFG